MRDATGIVFVEGHDGRRAALASCGLEVWEVIATWKEGGESWDVLRDAYPEIPEPELRAALNHYVLHPREIDARLALEAAWTPERLYTAMPFTRPSYLRSDPADGDA
jgi:uncharacterized protein (DUF433 family)